MLIIFQDHNRYRKHVIELAVSDHVIKTTVQEPALVTHTYWLRKSDYEQIQTLALLSGLCVNDRVYTNLEQFKNILANLESIVDK